MSDTLNNINNAKEIVESVNDSKLLSHWYDNPFFIGAAGAITGMLVPSDKKSIWQRIGMMIGGTMMAAFVSPLIANGIDIENSAYSNAITFLTGLVGMQIAGGLVKYFEEFTKDPKGFLAKHKPWGNKK